MSDRTANHADAATRRRRTSKASDADAPTEDQELRRWARDYWRLWLRNGRAPFPRPAETATDARPGPPPRREPGS